MSDDVLVDTSIWIAYFNSPQNPIRKEVTQLLREQRAVYTGIIATELIRGARSGKELSILETLFQSIKIISEQKSTHMEAGKIGYTMARNGFTLGTVDLLISQLAIENDLALYTQDQHFNAIAKYFPLKLQE
jgi:predicted nucleic acid-binding protein